MNFNNSTEAYVRPVTKIGVRRRFRSGGSFDLSTWLMLWKPAGKVLLMLFPLVLIINMFVASAVSNTERSIVVLDNKRHELMDKKIGLLASRARLWSPKEFQQLAGEKLALQENSGNQVGKFNRRTGTFSYRQ